MADDPITLDAVEVTAKASNNQSQFGRKLYCAIGGTGGGLNFSDFRVVFQVRRGDNQTPNTCNIRIYNVSKQTMAKVTQEFTAVNLQAGYENGNFGLIFKGVIKQFRKGRENATDTYLDILAADGDEAYNFAPILMTLASGSTPLYTVGEFLKSLKAFSIDPPDYIPPTFNIPSPHPRTYAGLAPDVLREFAQDHQCRWSIQDGQLTFIPVNSFLPGPIPLISPSTGLIGIPEQTVDGIEMRVLLNPTIKIGQLIQLQATVNQAQINPSLSGNQTNFQLGAMGSTPTGITGSAKLFGSGSDGSGYYYVAEADHSGDTRGNDWYTDLICVAADATTLPASISSNIASVAPANVTVVGSR